MNNRTQLGPLILLGTLNPMGLSSLLESWCPLSPWLWRVLLLKVSREGGLPRGKRVSSSWVWGVPSILWTWGFPYTRGERGGQFDSVTWKFDGVRLDFRFSVFNFSVQTNKLITIWLNWLLTSIQKLDWWSLMEKIDQKFYVVQLSIGEGSTSIK